MNSVSSCRATGGDKLSNSTVYKAHKVKPRMALKRTSSFDDSETDSEDELGVCDSSFGKPEGSNSAKVITEVAGNVAVASKVCGHS